MATVPTGRLERELRKLYLTWLSRVGSHSNDMLAYIERFQRESTLLIARLGGDVARLGVYLADFPAPKLLELSPRAGVIYDEMKQAAIASGIASGMGSRDIARAMLNAGLDKSLYKLTRLARTETVSAYWKNQWDSTAGLGLVMLWSVENGPRTCDYCIGRDGLVVADSQIRDHPNGRCTLIPTLAKNVAYKGTLQPDGSVEYDKRWDKRSLETISGDAGMALAIP